MTVSNVLLQKAVTVANAVLGGKAIVRSTLSARTVLVVNIQWRNVATREDPVRDVAITDVEVLEALPRVITLLKTMKRKRTTDKKQQDMPSVIVAAGVKCQASNHQILALYAAWLRERDTTRKQAVFDFLRTYVHDREVAAGSLGGVLGMVLNHLVHGPCHLSRIVV